MKIAKIFSGDPNNQKGQFNNILERTKKLKTIEPDVDCYIIRVQQSWLMRFLKRQLYNKEFRAEYTDIQGIRFKNIWIQMSFLDYIFTFKLNKKLNIANSQLQKHISLFSEYDLLSVHTYEAVALARLVKNNYKIPFVSTWHGSDINYRAFSNNKLEKMVANLLDEASHNFFVSDTLKDTALKISQKPNKTVLYTGPADIFYPYSAEKKEKLKIKYGLRQQYTVGFIGNFVSVKNVLVLPDVFYEIQRRIPEVNFVFVGDGELEASLRFKLNELDIKNVIFLGRFLPQEIPHILNCLDLLLLPSLNEGLPRVTLEAQACGVPVLGSNRGGIPEAIGKNNVFELDGNFVNKISCRATELLFSKLTIDLPSKFSWSKALEHERQVHLSSIYNRFFS